MYPPIDEGTAGSSNVAASSSSSSTRTIANALQVLAATASNDRLVRERYLESKSNATSPLSSYDDANNMMMANHHRKRRRHNEDDAGAMIPSADDKSSVDANVSEDDDSAGSGCSGSGSSGSAVISKTTGLRKGKWTAEEEEFATRFIHYFSSGLLCLPEGKTLRASLAEKLQCDPMRITKKYGGASCLGNKISKLCNRPQFLAQDIEMARLEIARLERRFHLRMAQGGDVPLPPDNTTENDMSAVVEMKMHAVTNSSPHLSGNACASAALVSSSGGGMHMNASFPQLGTASSISSVLHPVTTSVINATSQPALTIPQAGATTPSMSSYLATLAGNAQLAAAAASISPHTTASIMVGVPTPQQQHQSRPAPAAPLVQQQLNPTMNNITPTVSSQGAMTTTTTAGALPAVNWPLVFQGISQAGIGSTTADLSASNKQLVQTLVLQITSQLQALAALSPATMKQIQLLILAATTNNNTATPTVVPLNPPQPKSQQAPLSTWAAPAPATTDNANSLFSSFQLAAARQIQPGLSSATGGGGGVLPTCGSVGLPFVQTASAAPVRKNFLVSANANGSTSTSSISSSQTPQSNLVHHVQRHHHHNHRHVANQGLDKPGVPVHRDAGAASSSITSGGSASSNTNNMEEFINKLRQRHAEAVEQARREQSSDYHNHHGPVSKKQKKNKTADGGSSSSSSGNSGIVTLLPFEHATTESSGSGCTTNEGSTSSVENAPASDETRNDGSTSSNSSSEEDDAESGGGGGQATSSSSSHRSKPSIPLRKRFRLENNGGSSSNNGGGGITRRNLADHNYRMAEEMKNQDNK